MKHINSDSRIKEGLFRGISVAAYMVRLSLFAGSWPPYFTLISHLLHIFYTEFSEKLLCARTCGFTISCVTLNMEKTDVPCALLHKEHLFLCSYSPPDSEAETEKHCHEKRYAGKSFVPSGELRADVKSLAAYAV